ncbi:MAG TPA: hypothetical protein VGS99_01385, partial [Gammaproteobacteria bacterium]|nr:hypothetical protein [Gammaproteobacteria bacterium]
MNGPADNNLDFLSTLAVILCSAAITIFLFWLSSRLVGLQILENLPSFITGAYSGIWTAAAAGTAGIGLGIVKALTSKDRPQPNYLKWILIVTGLFLAITIVLTGGLYAFSRYMDSKKSATPAQTSSTQAATSQASDKTDTTKAPSVATSVHPAVAPQGTDTSPPSGVEKISDIPNSNTGFDLETQDGVSPLDVTISGTMR